MMREKLEALADEWDENYDPYVMMDPTSHLHAEAIRAILAAEPEPSAANAEGLREAIEALFESAKEMHECAMRNDVGGWKDLEYDKWRVQAERRYWDATNQARAALRGTGEGNP